MSSIDPDVPPTGEEIHLPGPTVQPILLAFAITIGVVGVTTSVFMVIAGVLMTLWVTLSWIRATRREIDELPLEHH
jgi:uncharacterized membrane protein (DUF106 family)